MYKHHVLTCSDNRFIAHVDSRGVYYETISVELVFFPLVRLD